MKTMRTTGHILRRPHQANAELAARTQRPEVTKMLGVGEVSSHRRRNRRGGRKADGSRL